MFGTGVAQDRIVAHRNGFIEQIDFSGKVGELAAAAETEVVIWGAAANGGLQVRHSYSMTLPGLAISVRYSPDGTTVAAGVDNGRLYVFQNGQQPRSFAVFEKEPNSQIPVRSIAFVALDQLAVASTKALKVYVYDFVGNSINYFTVDGIGEGISSLSANIASNLLAVGGTRGEVAVSDLLGTQKWRDSVAGGEAQVAVSPDGRTVAVGSKAGAYIQLFGASDGTKGQPVGGHVGGIDCLRFWREDADAIVTCGNSDKIAFITFLLGR